MTYDIECAVCGAGGSFKIEEGKTRFVLAENGTDHCRIFSDKRKNHLHEIKETHVEAFQNKELIRDRISKYNDYAVASLKK